MLKKSDLRQLLVVLSILQLLTSAMPLRAATVDAPQAKPSSGTAFKPGSLLGLLPIKIALQPESNSIKYETTPNTDMSLPGCEWQLPCEGKFQAVNPNAAALRLTGTVTAYDVDGDFGQLIDSLIDGAVYKTTKMTNLDNSVAHYRKPQQEKITDLKNAANSIIPYRGFGPSSEAADIILDEKIKIKNRSTAEYARQRYIDEIHPQVVAKVMQLAMALGNEDKLRREELVQSSMDSLKKLVGKDPAELTLQKLQAWRRDVQVPEALYGTASAWDVDFFHDKMKDVTKFGMAGDPVIKQLIDRLQKYNHQSMAKRASGKLVTSSFDIASFIMPGYVVPFALSAAGAGFVMATGGSEESKLMKELYYDKRVESRYRAINEEGQMALTQYQNALTIKNPVLLVCSESVLTQIVGAENINQILGGRTLLTHRIMGPHTMETAQNPTQPVQ